MLISVSASVSYIPPRAISNAYVGVIYLEHDIFTWYRPEGSEYKTVFVFFFFGFSIAMQQKIDFS